MARPLAEIDYDVFFELYGKGYPDAEIAKMLEVNRSTVVRRRREMGLPPNRKRGERGPAIKDNERYWQAARRALQYVGHYVRDAARDYYHRTKDFERFFLCFVMEPKPFFHSAPGPWVSDPAKMTFKAVKYITDYEKTADRMGLAGVPGPAILELARVYKSADEKTCRELAMAAVEGAGFINAETLVEDAIVMEPEIMIQHWQETEKEAMDWAPVQRWEPIKKISRIAKNIANNVGGGRSGKRGRGGGIQNISAHQAFQAIKGY